MNFFKGSPKLYPSISFIGKRPKKLKVDLVSEEKQVLSAFID